MFLKYTSPKQKDIALLVHGGCFTKGDEKWNSEQALSISQNCGITIYTLKFDTSSLEKSVNDICIFFQKLQDMCNSKIGIIGCSSGGFLVLHALKKIDPKFIVLICPVLNPKERELYVSEFIINEQQKFFGKSYPKANFTRKKLNIIAAQNDKNVPLDLLKKDIKRFPRVYMHILDETHSISYKSNKEVNEIIKNVV